MQPNEPLIVTLELDESSRSYFDSLRELYFPPERNHIPAHLSLFHRLPGELFDEVHSDLSELRHREMFPLRVEGLRLLGRGVALTLASQELDAVREELAQRWREHLTPQDRERFAPHVTIQNKVSPEEAKALRERLATTFHPFEVRAERLLLWRYLGGPWERLGEYPFEDSDREP